MDVELKKLHLLKVCDRFTPSGMTTFAKTFLRLTDIELLDVTSRFPTNVQYKWTALQMWRNRANQGRRNVLDLFVIVNKLRCGPGLCGCYENGARNKILDILSTNSMTDDLNADIMLEVAKFLTMEHMNEMKQEMKLSQAAIEGHLCYDFETKEMSHNFQCLQTWLRRKPESIVLSLYVLLWQAEKFSCRQQIVELGTAEALHECAVAESYRVDSMLRQNVEAELTKWDTILSGISEAGLMVSCQHHSHTWLSHSKDTVSIEVTTSLSSLEERMKNYLTKDPPRISETQIYEELLAPSQSFSGEDLQTSADRRLTLFFRVLYALMILPQQDVHVNSGCKKAEYKPLMQINLVDQSYSLLLEEKKDSFMMKKLSQSLLEAEKIDEKIERCLRSSYIHKYLHLPSSHTSCPAYSYEQHYIPRVLTTFSSTRRTSNLEMEIHESSLLHYIHHHTLVPRVVITAPSGSGKSTLLRNIARMWACNDAQISRYKYVFLIDGDRVRWGDTICTYIKREILRASIVVTEKRLKNLLHEHQSNMLWLIDGLDHMVKRTKIVRSEGPTVSLNHGENSDFMSLLEGEYLPESTVIMTGYPNIRYVLKNQEQFSTYKIVPLTYRDIKHFLSKLPDEVRRTSLMLGVSNHELASLMETPQFLWLAVRLCELEGDNTIFERTTKSFLMNKLFEAIIRETFSFTASRVNQLRKQAHLCLKQNTDYFNCSKTYEMQALIDAEAGILTPFQPNPKHSDTTYYRFNSGMMMSFLAAQYIVRHSLYKVKKNLARLRSIMANNEQGFMIVLSFVIGLLSLKTIDEHNVTMLSRIKSQTKLQRYRQACAKIITTYCSSVRCNDHLHETHQIFSCIAEAAPILDQQFCKKISYKLCKQLFYNEVLCMGCCRRAILELLEHGVCDVYINGEQISNPKDFRCEITKLHQSNRREACVNMDNLSRTLGSNGVYNGVEMDRLIIKDCPAKLELDALGTITTSELQINSCNPLLVEQLLRHIKELRRIKLCDMTKSAELRTCVVQTLMIYHPSIQEFKLKDKAFSVHRSLIQNIPKLIQLRKLSLDTTDSDISLDKEALLLDNLLTSCSSLKKVVFIANNGSALRNIPNLPEKLKYVSWSMVRLVGISMLEMKELILQCTSIRRCTSLFTTKKSDKAEKPSAVLIASDDAPVNAVWKELLASGSHLATVELHCNDLLYFMSLLNYGKEKKNNEFQQLSINYLIVHLQSKLNERDYMRHNVMLVLPNNCPDISIRGSVRSSVEVDATCMAGYWIVKENKCRNSDTCRL